MKSHFHAAPWTTSLKVVSLAGTLVLGGVSCAAYLAVPTPAGFTHYFGLGVALIPIVVLASAVLFIVNGYTVDSSEFFVERPFHSTRVSLDGLVRVWTDSGVCKGSLRVFGNGGLFSFTGWFQNQRLGRYRLFATDFRNGVVLKFADKVVVVTPASPQAFIDHLRRVVPGLHVGPEDGGTADRRK